jgi:F-type H+-transporting ATPase subunit epsilon
MADAPMVVEVVTPEQALLETPASAIVLRTSDGDLTILPGHTPLVTDVVSSAVRVDAEEGESKLLAVHGGFLHVDTGPGAASGTPAAADGEAEAPAGETSTRVRLLAGIAELAEQIDLARAQAAKSAAEAKAAELRSAGVKGTAALEEEATAENPAEAPTEQDLELDEAEAAARRADLRIEVVQGPETAA